MEFKPGAGGRPPTIHLSAQEVSKLTGKTSEEISEAIPGMILDMPQLGEITLRQAEKIHFKPPSLEVKGARRRVPLYGFARPVLMKAVKLKILAEELGVEIHNPRNQEGSRV